MAATSTTLPTVLPCPPWCTRPAGHPLEDEFDGEAQRTHLAFTADVTDHYRSVVHVGVFTVETVTATDVEVTAPALEVMAQTEVHLDSEQAERLALALQAGAATLRRITTMGAVKA